MVKYAPRKVYIRESGGYVELSYTEFCRCRESDQTYMDKLFIPIQGCLLEVVREQYTDFYRDKERWRYLQKLDTKNRLLSLDGFTDSEGNPLDFITDEAVDIAETVVNAVMVDRLKAALPLLSDSEQELIQAIFFDGLSEREVGARLGITQSVVNKRKARSFIVQYRITKLLKSTLFVKLPAIRFHILTSFLVGKLVVLPPFSRGNTAFFKNAEDFLKFLQKFFERTKCARPKSPDGRIGIVSSIQMIRQFIYISVVSPGGGRAFFDKSITVGFCRYAFCFMAATSFSRRFQQ